MVRDPFALPEYGALMRGRTAAVCGCPGALGDAVAALLLEQGAEAAVRGDVPPPDADVVVSGFPMPEAPPADGEAPAFAAAAAARASAALFGSLEHMKAQRWGAVVQLLPSCVSGAVPGSLAVSAAAGAAEAMVRAFAADVCRWNIRANCVLLPFSMTDGDWHEDLQLLRRPGTAEDAARAVLYLASPMSAFLTGASLPLNGGAFVIGHNQKWRERYLKMV